MFDRKTVPRTRYSVLAYVMDKETALSRSNPALLKALRIGELAFDQREALYASIDLVGLPPHISETFVVRADAPSAEIRGEFLLLDRATWGTMLMKIARIINGARERRDAVRDRLAFALRVRRLVSTN